MTSHKALKFLLTIWQRHPTVLLERKHVFTNKLIFWLRKLIENGCFLASLFTVFNFHGMFGCYDTDHSFSIICYFLKWNLREHSASQSPTLQTGQYFRIRFRLFPCIGQFLNFPFGIVVLQWPLSKNSFISLGICHGTSLNMYCS